MDRGAWWATVYRVTKSQTWLSNFHFNTVLQIYCRWQVGKKRKQENWILNYHSDSHSVMSDSLYPMDYSPPGSSVHRIFQARILEWVAVFFSRGSSQPRDQTHISRITGGFFTVWATREVQEYWSGLPCPPSRESSQPRDPAQVSHIAGRLLTVPPGKPMENQIPENRAKKEWKVVVLRNWNWGLKRDRFFFIRFLALSYFVNHFDVWYWLKNVNIRITWNKFRQKINQTTTIKDEPQCI